MPLVQLEIITLVYRWFFAMFVLLNLELCGILLVFLSFFFWSFHCLSFFDLPLLITTLCKMATNCNFREKGYTRQNNLILILELQCKTLISINYMTCILWSKESFMDIKLNTCLKTGPDYPIGQNRMLLSRTPQAWGSQRCKCRYNISRVKTCKTGAGSV